MAIRSARASRVGLDSIHSRLSARAQHTGGVGTLPGRTTAAEYATFPFTNGTAAGARDVRIATCEMQFHVPARDSHAEASEVVCRATRRFRPNRRSLICRLGWLRRQQTPARAPCFPRKRRVPPHPKSQVRIPTAAARKLTPCRLSHQLQAPRNSSLGISLVESGVSLPHFRILQHPPASCGPTPQISALWGYELVASAL